MKIILSVKKYTKSSYSASLQTIMFQGECQIALCACLVALAVNKYGESTMHNPKHKRLALKNIAPQSTNRTSVPICCFDTQIAQQAMP